MRRFVFALASVACSLALPVHHTVAWSDEGHEIIALVADRFLEPPVREGVRAMLAADPDDLTAHDGEATWADRYRDFDRRGSREHYEQTSRWHFVNIERPEPRHGLQRASAATAAHLCIEWPGTSLRRR